MDLKVEPKEVLDAYSTTIVQQTAFWSRVKERLGMHSCAFEYSVRNSDLYDGVAPNADESHPMYGHFISSNVVLEVPSSISWAVGIIPSTRRNTSAWWPAR